MEAFSARVVEERVSGEVVYGGIFGKSSMRMGFWTSSTTVSNR